MTNVIRFPQTRSLTFVLAELMLARGERDRIYDSLNGREPTREEDARLTELDDKIWLREDEARALIASATGVSFDAIQAANL